MYNQKNRERKEEMSTEECDEWREEIKKKFPEIAAMWEIGPHESREVRGL